MHELPEEPLNETLFREHLAVLQQRVDAVLAATGFDGLAIPAGTPQRHFLDDHGPPFKCNPHFNWWVPEPQAAGAWVVVVPGRRPRLLFPQAADYWHAPPRLPDGEWVGLFDLQVFDEQAGIPSALLGDTRRLALIGEPTGGIDPLAFASINPPALLAHLHEQRVRKTGYELDCQRRASRRGVVAHDAAAQCFLGGGSEFEIHQAFMAAGLAREQELPYNAIVATNRNASVLHYQHLGRLRPTLPLNLLLDAGMPWRGYGSDITRTVPAPAAPPEFHALVARMDRLQQELCSQIRQGTDWVALHLQTHERLAKVLCEAGLWRGSVDAAVSRGITRAFLPHGLGHLLGLQVHDVAGRHPRPDGPVKPPPPGHETLRLTRTLEAGFVVTVEPGLYFIDLLLDPLRASSDASLIDWAQIEVLRPCGGIRIEDNVAVTETGNVNLTREVIA
jgi:Xaa-Pro dipeptidase